MPGSIEAFRAQLQTQDDLVRRRLDVIVLEVGLRIAENVVVGGKYGPGSPVDTGFFRSAWVAGVNQDAPEGPSQGRRRTADEGDGPLYSTDMPDEMTLALAGVKAGDKVQMANNAVYGIELEYGHSPQATDPPGIVRGVMAQGQAIVNEVVRDVIAAG